ncbi:hypothetical protein JCGZ_10140 [Jatropha curcas]|uniref:Uncharacterized protein n=1 Tax=Jatropha curcas TaxID=180498 RepID=A0A067LN94_JATCU|nr:uncharacterized protein At3g27210 [Jatropha curcas]KDP46300.1 hypothetical protein JCGZ_10140 [Jatropha curcas]
MGSCVSVHKGTSESAVKLGLSFGSKKDNHVIPESPIKDKQVNGDYPQIKTFEDYGSKDEVFFDSQPWLDSDCDDDFLSVNGEFTPSRGSTPVHHSFAMGTPKINKTNLEDRSPASKPEPSPTVKKKLSELFRESRREEPDTDDQQTSDNQNINNGKIEVKQTILDVLPKSASGTPYVSGPNSVCSSERTANGEPLFQKEKSIKSAQCCLPSLLSCHSFSERKKKMSPAIAVNDRA